MSAVALALVVKVRGAAKFFVMFGMPNSTGYGGPHDSRLRFRRSPGLAFTERPAYIRQASLHLPVARANESSARASSGTRKLRAVHHADWCPLMLLGR